MLRVVVPYVDGMLRDETRVALSRYGYPLGIEYDQIDAADPLAYGRAVKRLWAECLKRGDDLAIVEQDIEVGPSTLYDFRACQYGFCGAPYNWGTDVGVALGCTRFRHWFIAAYPSAAERAFALAPHFRQFDVALVRGVLVEQYGEQPHVHAPVVHHSKPLLPGANPEPLARLPKLSEMGNVGVAP